LLEVGRSWISEVWEPIESSSDELKWPEKQPTPCGGPNRNPHPKADSTGISTNTKWTKLLLMVRAVSMLQHSVKCILQIRSKVTLDRFVNSVLFLFMGGGVLFWDIALC